MGYPITTYKDYEVGRFVLPFNTITVKDLNNDIEDTEEDLIDCLLGIELAGLLIDDLDGNNVPQTDRFTKIWDKFILEDSCRNKILSKGIIDMIKTFVFFQNGRRGTNVLTIAGVKKSDSDNSNDGDLAATPLLTNYNRGVRTYKAIQSYICDNASIYPEFNGSSKDYVGRI
jgi:hypothetical protein